MPGTPLELGLSTASSASTGDDLLNADFSAVFGDKNGGGSEQPANTIFTGYVRDFAVSVAVALAAKYLWKMIK